MKKASTFENIVKIAQRDAKKRKTTLKRIVAPPKTKQKSIAKLKKELWTVFSKFIRERDKYTCFTCGKYATGGGMHAAHYRTGATCKLPLFFNEKNVHAGCYHCNINLSGNWRVYQRKMHEIYGKEIDDEFDKINQWSGTGKEFPFVEKTEYYKGLIATTVTIDGKTYSAVISGSSETK